MKKGTLWLCVSLAALAGRSQTVGYKVITQEYEMGGSVSWPEVVSAPNAAIEKAITQRVSSCVLGTVEGESSVRTLDELKKRAGDKVNPLVADYTADCKDCESTHSVSLSQLYGTVAVSCSDAGYCCGAHGYYGIGITTFDVATGRELGLPDLFGPGYEDAFKRLGEEKIRTENEIPEGQSLEEFGYFGFAEGMVLSQNWIIGLDGLSFIYNPYEVGPWAIPPPYFTLGFDEIGEYVLPSGPLGQIAKQTDTTALVRYRGTLGKKREIVLAVSGGKNPTGWYYPEKEGTQKRVELAGSREGIEVVLTEQGRDGIWILQLGEAGGAGIRKSRGKTQPVRLNKE